MGLPEGFDLDRLRDRLRAATAIVAASKLWTTVDKRRPVGCGMLVTI